MSINKGDQVKVKYKSSKSGNQVESTGRVIKLYRDSGYRIRDEENGRDLITNKYSKTVKSETSNQKRELGTFVSVEKA